MTKIKLLLALAVCVGLGGCAITPHHINWTGNEVAVGAGDKWFHKVGWLDKIELGLRDDGVLVYRKMP